MFSNLIGIANLLRINLHLWNSHNNIGCNSFTDVLMTDVAESSMPNIWLDKVV